MPRPIQNADMTGSARNEYEKKRKREMLLQEQRARQLAAEQMRRQAEMSRASNPYGVAGRSTNPYGSRNNNSGYYSMLAGANPRTDKYAIPGGGVQDLKQNPVYQTERALKAAANYLTNTQLKAKKNTADDLRAESESDKHAQALIDSLKGIDTKTLSDDGKKYVDTLLKGLEDTRKWYASNDRERAEQIGGTYKKQYDIDVEAAEELKRIARRKDAYKNLYGDVEQDTNALLNSYTGAEALQRVGADYDERRAEYDRRMRGFDDDAKNVLADAAYKKYYANFDANTNKSYYDMLAQENMDRAVSRTFEDEESAKQRHAETTKAVEDYKAEHDGEMNQIRQDIRTLPARAINLKYGSREAAQARLDELTEGLDKLMTADTEAGRAESHVVYQRELDEAYKDYTSRDDFDEKAAEGAAAAMSYEQMVAAANGGTIADTLKRDEAAARHAYINADPAEQERMSRTWEGAEILEDYKYLNPVDRKIYNYIYATEGAEAADAYIEKLEPTLKRVRSTEEERQARIYATTNPVEASIGSALLSPLAGLEMIANVGENIRGTDDALGSTTGTIMTPGKERRTIRDQVQKDIIAAAPTEAEGKAGTFLYGTGMSMADNIVNMLVGFAVTGGAGAVGAEAEAVREAAEKVTLVLMSSAAATDAYQDSIDKGMTGGQAIVRSLVSGLIEYATEKIGLDNLFGMINGGKTTAIQFLRNTASQMLSEGGEEVLSSLANEAWDIMTKNEFSDTQIRIRELMETEGLTEAEATAKAYDEFWVQTGLEGLGGAISGGVMGAGATGLNAAMYGIKSSAARTQIAQQMASNTEAQRALVNAGMQFAGQAQTNAQQLIRVLDEGGELTQAQIEEQLRLNDKAYRKASVEQEDEQRKQTKQYEKAAAQDAESQQALIDEAKEIGGAAAENAEALQRVLDEEGGLSRAQVRELIQANQTQIQAGTEAAADRVREMGVRGIPYENVINDELAAQYLSGDQIRQAYMDGLAEYNANGGDEAASIGRLNARTEAAEAQLRENTAENTTLFDGLAEARIGATGGAVRLTGIDSIQDGEIYFSTADGGFVSSNDLSSIGNANANNFVRAIQNVYDGARTGLSFEQVTRGSFAASSFLTAGQARAAYNAGVQSLQGGYYGTEGDVLLHGSGQRADGENTGVEGGRVAENAAEAERKGSRNAEAKGRAGKESVRGNAANQRITAKSEGVKGGLDKGNARLISLNEIKGNKEYKKLYDRAKKDGIRLRLFEGRMFAQQGENEISFNGAHQGDTIWVRVDANVSLETLYDHEYAHHLMDGAKGQELLLDVIAQISDVLSDEEIKTLANTYAEDYLGGSDDQMLIYEEMAADAYAGMHGFDAWMKNTDELSKANQARDAFAIMARELVSEAQGTRGSPEGETKVNFSPDFTVGDGLLDEVSENRRKQLLAANENTYFITTREDLERHVHAALSGDSKANLQIGVLPLETLERVNAEIPNKPKEINTDILFNKYQYAIEISYDAIRHMRNEHGFSEADIMEYIMAMPAVLRYFDSVYFSWYTKTGNPKTDANKQRGLRFKKLINGQTQVVYELVSKKRNVLQLKTDFEAKLKEPGHSAKSQMRNGETSETTGASALTDNISPAEEKSNTQNVNNSKTSFSREYMNLAEKYRDGKATEAETEQLEDMVQAAAESAGYKIKGMHGTTHMFWVFNRDLANPEGDWGKGYYFTTNEDDVEGNYATREGADITQRIEVLAERLEYMDGYEDMDYDQRLEAAEKMLAGEEERVIRAALKADNPVVIGGKNETVFDYTDGYNPETDEYEDEEGGLLLEFLDAVRDEIEENYEWENYDRLDFSGLMEYAYDGGLTASQLEKKAKEVLAYVEDDEGNLAGNEIIRAAFERMGFDGIIDNTVAQKFGTRSGRKNGGMVGVNEETQHIIVFGSNQIKVLDPVTYNDEGNIIPLEERFNAKNEDIRFSRDDPRAESIKEQIRAHQDELNKMEPVADIKTEPRPRTDRGKGLTPDKALMRKRILEVYGQEDLIAHREGFGDAIFDKYAMRQLVRYIETDAEYAAVMAAPAVIEKGIEIDSHEDHKDNPDVDSYTFAAPVYLNGKRGNDGVVVHITTAPNTESGTITRPHVVRILMPDGSGFDLDALENENAGGFRKSVVQDAQPTNPSTPAFDKSVSEEKGVVKFSIENVSPVDTAALEDENASLKKALTAAEAQLKNAKGAAMTDKQYESWAKRILKEYSSSYKADELKDDLRMLFNFISAGVTEQSIADLNAYGIGVAKEILENSSTLDRTAYDDTAELRKYLRETPFSVSDADKAEIAAVYGSYGDWRKSMFGKLNIKNDAQSMDSMWQELVAGYGAGWFDADTTIPDMPVRLTEFFDAIAPRSAKYHEAYGYTKDEAAIDLWLNMQEHFIGQTLGDAQAAEIRKQIQAMRAASKASFDARYKEIKMKWREDGTWRMLSQEREAAILRAIAASRKYENLRRSTQKRELKGKITRIANDLSSRLTHPTENRHVPKGMVQAVAELAKAIDMGNMPGSAVWQKMQALHDAYEALAKDEDFAVKSEYDEMLSKRIDDLRKELQLKTKGKTLREMSVDELRSTYEILKAVQKQVRDEGKLIMKGKRIDAYQTAQRIIEEVKAAKGAAIHSPGNWYLSKTLDPRRQFRRMSGYAKNSQLEMLGKDLNDGQLRQTQIMMEGSQIFDPLFRNKEMRKKAANFQGKRAEWIDTGVKDSENRPVKLTPAMRVSLYLHSLNEDNMRHILNGGIRVPNAKEYARGNYATAFKSGTTYYLTEQNVKDIVAGMEDFEREFARLAYDFFNGFSKKYINETSLALNGYKKANVKNYFPITVDKSYLEANFDVVSENGAIENMGGRLNERQSSGLPIYLEDAANVVDRQLNNVAAYAGLAVPMRNFKKAYSVRSMGYRGSAQEAINETWHEQGRMYIDNLMKDLAKARRQDGGRIFSVAKGMFAQATLAMNISVTMKQMASYPTAAAVLGWKPLMKALVKGGRKGMPISRADVNLIKKYSPLLWYRNQGYNNPELGDIVKDKGWSAKVPWLMGWINKTDAATVGRLWYAAEYYVQKHSPNLKVKSDEYYQEVARMFNKTVEETQPNYTTMQRPDILRNPNAVVKGLTMFMTQRLQNSGILIDAAGEYRARLKDYRANKTEAAKADLKAAGANLARAVSSQLVAAATIAAMTLLAKAVTHKMDPYRDEKKELTWESIMSQMGEDVVSTLIGSFLGGNEIYEIINKFMGRGYGNVIEVGYLATINDIIDTVEKIGKAGQDLLEAEGEAAQQSALENLLPKLEAGVMYIGQAVGIPFRNAKNLAKGLIQHGQDIAAGIETGEYKPFATGAAQMTASESYAAMYDALMDGDIAAYNRYYQTAYDTQLEKLDETKYTDTAMEAEKKIAQGIVNELKDRNADIALAAGYMQQGEYRKATELYDKLEEQGFDREWIYGAVKKYLDSQKEKEPTNSTAYDATAYTKEMIIWTLERGAETGDYSDYDALFQAITEEKGSEDKALQYVKTTLGSEYKSTYIDAMSEEPEQPNAAETAQKIEKTYEAAGIGTKSLDTIKTKTVQEQMTESAASGDYAKISGWITTMREEGKEPNDISDNLRLTFRPIYMEAYAGGDMETCEEIEKYLLGLGLKTNTGKDVNFKKSIKGWQEKAG